MYIEQLQSVHSPPKLVEIHKSSAMDKDQLPLCVRPQGLTKCNQQVLMPIPAKPFFTSALSAGSSPILKLSWVPPSTFCSFFLFFQFFGNLSQSKCALFTKLNEYEIGITSDLYPARHDTFRGTLWSGANLCDYFVIIHGHHKICGIRDASVTA